MHISLPDSLKAFVEEQVAEKGYRTSSEYVRELIRRDQDRQHLRNLLLDGAQSPPARPVDAAYFDALRGTAVSPCQFTLLPLVVRHGPTERDHRRARRGLLSR
jgi:antitoxin ParD1/3/4